MSSAAKGREREHAAEAEFAKIGMYARRAGGSRGTDIIVWATAPLFAVECGGSGKSIVGSIRKMREQFPTSIPLVRLTLRQKETGGSIVRWSCCSKHKFKRLVECIAQAKSEAA